MKTSKSKTAPTATDESQGEEPTEQVARPRRRTKKVVASASSAARKPKTPAKPKAATTRAGGGSTAARSSARSARPAPAPVADAPAVDRPDAGPPAQVAPVADVPAVDTPRTDAPVVGTPGTDVPAASAATPSGITPSEGVTKTRARTKARAKPAASSGRGRGRGAAARAPAQTPARALQAGDKMPVLDSLETGQQLPDPPHADSPSVAWAGAELRPGDSPELDSPETDLPPGQATESVEGLALASSVDFSLAQPIAPPAVEPAPPPAAWRPRRVVFIDVENTSSEASLSGVLDELDLGGLGTSTEVVAIGNWRVIGQGLARSLAARGVQLVHSAPAARVRDWSDLWIAVQAGIWLGRARAGDALDIVSHDRAFDALGDAASRLGVGFRRFTYGRGASKPEADSRPRPTRTASGGGGRQRGGRAGRGRGSSATTESAATPTQGGRPASPKQAGSDAGEAADRRSATPGQIIAVLRRLTADDPPAGAAIDWLTEALKQAGFHRPPGSPRLITRLKRIKDVEVMANGRLRLASAAPKTESQQAGGDTEASPPEVDTAQLAVLSPESSPEPGNEAQIGEQEAVTPNRRSRRRGGRRRGGRGRQDSTEPETVATDNPATEEDG